MQITGSYRNYLTVTTLLAPLGVKSSGDLVMQVFSSAVKNLQNRIDQQIFSKDSEAALKQLYGDVSDLASKAKKLTLTDLDSVFNDRTPTSSDTNVLTATATDAFSQNPGAAEATYEISVAQLAQAQENTGLELNATDTGLVGEGTNTFNINVGGQDYELSIDLVQGDTNEDVLGKMAQAINDAGIGLAAEVRSGSEVGTKKLAVSSNDTGVSAGFTISDLSGNAVTATGAATVSTAAQDAAYEVDGVGYTATTNSIDLDEGKVTVNLQGVGESVLTVAPDETKVRSAITDMVSEVNALIGSLGKNSDYIKDEVLSTIYSFIDDHEKQLEAFGITLGEDGKLEVDTNQLATAAGQDMAGIKEAFGGFDGLAVQMENYASRVATDSPLNYAKEAESLSMGFTDLLYSSSASMMQQILQGSMLNSYL